MCAPSIVSLPPHQRRRCAQSLTCAGALASSIALTRSLAAPRQSSPPPDGGHSRSAPAVQVGKHGSGATALVPHSSPRACPPLTSVVCGPAHSVALVEYIPPPVSRNWSSTTSLRHAAPWQGQPFTVLNGGPGVAGSLCGSSTGSEDPSAGRNVPGCRGDEQYAPRVNQPLVRREHPGGQADSAENPERQRAQGAVPIAPLRETPPRERDGQERE